MYIDNARRIHSKPSISFQDYKWVKASIFV